MTALINPLVVSYRSNSSAFLQSKLECCVRRIVGTGALGGCECPVERVVPVDSHWPSVRAVGHSNFNSVAATNEIDHRCVKQHPGVQTDEFLLLAFICVMLYMLNVT